VVRSSGDGDPGPGAFGDLRRDGLEVGVGLQLGRGCDPHVHAEQGPGGVVPGVAEIAIRDVAEVLQCVLGHGQDVGQHLGGVPLGGQPVPHRHPRVAATGHQGGHLDAVH
jgi:hypothetical protein